MRPVSEYSAEFDFVEDDSGGRFVAVGGPLLQLRALLAQGDIDAAVALYEETAGSARDGLIEEAKSASFDLKKAISLMLVRARDFGAAGLVFELARLENEAAKNYEQAGSSAAAGACYERSGELLKAAACFERAGKVERALELYQSAGAKEPLAECLARQRRFDEAAVVYRGPGQHARRGRGAPGRGAGAPGRAGLGAAARRVDGAVWPRAEGRRRC